MALWGAILISFQVYGCVVLRGVGVGRFLSLFAGLLDLRGYAMFTSAASRGFQMSATRLRQHAARLLALSLRASDDGRMAESDELPMKAA